MVKRSVIESNIFQSEEELPLYQNGLMEDKRTTQVTVLPKTANNENVF